MQSLYSIFVRNYSIIFLVLCFFKSLWTGNYKPNEATSNFGAVYFICSLRKHSHSGDVTAVHACRLDNLIMEAVASLKEPGGSNKTAIATYIEVICYCIGNIVELNCSLFI